MIRSRAVSKYLLPILVMSFFGTYVNTHGQMPDQFCRQANSIPNKDILIEVTRMGRGMTWPITPQLFFRVYVGGRIEYEVRNNRHLLTKTGRIDSTAIVNLKKLLEAKDLVEQRREYPMLEGVKDALMKTCVTYGTNGQYQQVLLINYTPDLPKARGYYTASLVELLTLIQHIRPANDYERRHGFDKLSFR